MLTDAKIRKLKPEAKKKRYSDEKGMYLEITPSGGMYWRLKYRFNQKENVYSIGVYPEVSLAQARLIRDDARKLLTDGIDPNQAKKANITQASGENTFRYVAMEWHNKKTSTWAASTIVKVNARLDKDILPYLGDLDLTSSPT